MRCFFVFLVAIFIGAQGLSAEVLDTALALIQEIPSVQDEARLLKEVPVASNDDLLDHEVARYEWGRVMINPDRLDKELAESNADETLAAAHVASSIVHELRHALNQRLLPHIANSIEEEMSAFVSELAAYSQIKEKNLKAFQGQPTEMSKYSKDLWKVWKKEGPEGLKKWVKSRYFIKSVEDEFYWEAFNQERSYLMGALDQLPQNVMSFERAQNRCGGDSLEKDCLRASGFTDNLQDWIKLCTHGLISTKENALDKSHRQAIKDQMLVWDSEDNHRRIVEFYRQENCRAWFLWKEHFPQEKEREYFPSYCLSKP